MSEDLLADYGFKKPPEDPMASFLENTFGSQEEVAEPAQEEQQEPQPDFQVAMDAMSEAELRINKARLYQQLMNGSFFDGDNEVTQEVESEMREFASQKLQELLGMRQPETNSSAFSDEQVMVLKSLADNMTSNAKLMASLNKAQPTKKGVKATVAPMITSEPVLKARPLPKGVGRPVGSKNVAKPVAKPAAQQPQVAKTEDTKIVGVPAEGAEIIENGKKYVIKHSELIDAPAIDADKITSMAPNTTMILSDGTWVGCRAKGSYVRLRKSQIRGANKPAGGVPPLTINQFDQVTAQQGQLAGGGITPLRYT